MYSAEKTQWERLGLASLLLVGKHFLNVKKRHRRHRWPQEQQCEAAGDRVLRHTCLDHYPRSAICCLLKGFTISFAEQRLWLSKTKEMNPGTEETVLISPQVVCLRTAKISRPQCFFLLSNKTKNNRIEAVGVQFVLAWGKYSQPWGLWGIVQTTTASTQSPNPLCKMY